jgi:serine/threonine-protein kinase HipA
VTGEIPIFYETRKVGTIVLCADGPQFAYDPDWLSAPLAFPISLRMPLGRDAVPSQVLIPWLANLLPEGQTLITIGRNLGVAPDDVIGLVESIGRDTAGALSVGQPTSMSIADYRPIPDAEALERIIEELPRKPFLAGEAGISMSLAGAQEKLPLAIVDGEFAVPVSGAPSTHILKPDNKHLFGSVQNEAFCLVLARRMGLSVAEATTGSAGERSYLLVTRYDRRQTDRGWFRLHQEDLCQALGKPPAAKYEHNQSGIKGPSLKDFFELAREHFPGDLARLTDAVIVNVLLTNVDSHAKNYSILLTNKGGRLAPLYDLMCGDAWDNITQNLPQDVGDQRRGRHIAEGNWRRMAQDCGLNPTGLVRRVGELAYRVEKEIDAAANEVRAMPAGDHVMLREFVEAVRGRCKTVAISVESRTDRTRDRTKRSVQDNAG